MDKEEIVQQAVRRFKLVVDAESRQRQREVDDLRFQVPEEQWDSIARQQRASGAVAGVPVPARPTLAIPKLDQPVQLVLNQQRNAHLGINIHPLSEDADKDTAQVIQGLYRKIERDSRADLARSWAFERAVKAGRGYYRVDVRYDDDSGSPFDFKIVLDRILYQGDVYLDPGATQPDWSDGRYAFIVSWMPLEMYREKFPKSSITGGDGMAFQSAFQDRPEWTTGTGDERSVLVAEYFTKTMETGELALLESGLAVPAEKVPKGAKVLATREVEIPRVHWYLTNGVEVLDEEPWLGKHIPIIPVPGRELQPFSSERRWCGIIGPAKDGQRLYNYAASAAVELVALEPRAPFIGDPRQFEGYEGVWQQANTRNFPYLPYNSVSDNGTQLPAPTRVQIDANRMGPTMMLLQQADSFIQAATATFDPALGKIDPQARSGRAILALQSQSDAGTTQYMQQLADVAMAYEARVVLDLLPKVYKRPGRIAEILDGEDETRRVMLNAPYTQDQRGNPQRVMGDNALPRNAKIYDLTAGVYGVSIAIGKSYQTRLQQGSDEIGQILQSRPELMPLIGPTYFRFRDFPGAQEIADLLKRMRDKQFPGISSDDDDQPDPQEIQGKLAGAEQQIQMLQQQLQQAAQAIETEQAKQQAMLQKTKMDNETRLAIEAMKIQNEQVLARLEATQKALADMAKHESTREEGAKERQHEMAQGAADAELELIKIAAQPKPGPLGSDYDEDEREPE